MKWAHPTEPTTLSLQNRDITCQNRNGHALLIHRRYPCTVPIVVYFNQETPYSNMVPLLLYGDIDHILRPAVFRNYQNLFVNEFQCRDLIWTRIGIE